MRQTIALSIVLFQITLSLLGGHHMGNSRLTRRSTQEPADGQRLAAVAVADVVGYSRHLERDETGTLARLAAIRREIVGPTLDGYNGRLVKTLGDGVLVEFPTAIDAVACSANIQHRLTEENRVLTEPERIECRIGVNFGEVIDIGGDIFGTDVNIAARLEAIGAPGAICVSGAILDQARHLITGKIVDLGLQALKNIERAVHVYLIWPAKGTAEIDGNVGMAARPSRRPSLAVLPFEIVGGVADDTYLGQGIAEDLLSALARCRWFFVISPSSSFTTGAIRDDIRRTAARLGVRYVVDGTIRRSGERLRISAELVDGRDGAQLWAAHYDRMAGEMFAVQDEIVETIATTIEPELEINELRQAQRKRPERLDAQDCFYRAHWLFNQTNRVDNESAKSWYRRAIELEPTFARAYAGLAYANYADAVFGYVSDPAAAVTEGFELARQAVSLDPRDAFAHQALGRIYMLMGRHEASISELQRAIELNPNNGLAHYGLAFSLVMAGKPERGLPLLMRAQRLSPNDPLLWAFHTVSALAHQILGAKAEAEFAARRAVESPTAEFWAWLQLAIALGHRNKRAEAADALAEALRANPNFSVDMLDRTFIFRNPADRRIYIDGLIAAGLPEPADV